MRENYKHIANIDVKFTGDNWIKVFLDGKLINKGNNVGLQGVMEEASMRGYDEININMNQDKLFKKNKKYFQDKT